MIHEAFIVSIGLKDSLVTILENRELHVEELRQAVSGQEPLRRMASIIASLIFVILLIRSVSPMDMD